MLHRRTTNVNAFASQERLSARYLRAREYSERSFVTPKQKCVEVGPIAHAQGKRCFASCTAHITEHFLPPPDVPAPLTESATLAASVNASLTPRFRFAEHSAPAIDISTLLSIANQLKI